MGKRSEPLGEIATKVLFENEKVKVWNLIVEAGQASPWHVHSRDYITVIVDGGGLTVEYEDGPLDLNPTQVGTWNYHVDHKAHRVINNTNNRYKNVLIELKK